MPSSSETCKIKREYQKAHGICTCCGHRPARDNRTMCDICSIKSIAATKISGAARKLRLKDCSVCINCGKYPSDGQSQLCIDCHAKQLACSKHGRDMLKLEVINYYGGKCACCGESKIEFLTIDHIDGGGAIWRKIHGQAKTYIRLKQQGFPDGFQVLCLNCNMGRVHNSGICPHQGNYRPQPLTNKGQLTRATREYVVQQYGGKCVICGESHPLLLALDHVNDDGHQHRQQVKGNTKMYQWIIKNNFPDTLQLLCHNHNMAKIFSGIYDTTGYRS